MTKEQVKKDRKKEIIRHKERIAWLESENPSWSCGTPVFISDIKILLEQSYRIINGESHV
jgi:hypothetical protein